MLHERETWFWFSKHRIYRSTTVAIIPAAYTIPTLIATYTMRGEEAAYPAE